MTDAATALASQAVVLFEGLKELDKTHPDDVLALLGTMVAHIRSWKPFVLTSAPGDDTATKEAGMEAPPSR